MSANNNPLISILIPIYGQGKQFLNDLLNSIHSQTYKNIEILLNEERGAARSLNTLLGQAQGEIIKPMFQDDYFINPDSLQRFSTIKGWGVCTSEHTSKRGDHVPYINHDLYSHDKGLAEGCNTYGCPSAVAWRHSDIRFDENLAWLFDAEFYVRLIEQFGQAEIIDTSVMIREWDGMATRSIAGATVLWEREYVSNKYSDKRSE